MDLPGQLQVALAMFSISGYLQREPDRAFNRMARGLHLDVLIGS
ncbi:MAG TPA: hypothetical protein VHR41_01370 [Gemmatimonadales bacterium]|jgi:hypothetical protein|nr:hypothetical protein [Gemmatimonadales bacterium]